MIPLKSKHEIEKIRQACLIVAEVLERCAELVRDGISSGEIDKQVEKWIRNMDAAPSFLGYMGYPASTCISVNEEVVHGIPGPRRLKKGDIVGIDVGVVKDGFFGDAATTFAVGSVDEQKQLLLDSTRRSLQAGILNAKKDGRIGDISYAIQTTVERDGFEPVRALVGHGVGKAVHEEPQVPNFGKAGIGPKIEDGMVLAIEPMVNAGSYEVYTESDGWTTVTEDGEPSAHFEHTIAVVNGQPEILTVI